MKTKNLFSAFTLIVFAIMFWASATQEPTVSYNTITKYSNVSDRKTAQDTIIRYTLPKFQLIDNTLQTQTKGGVTITCEIIPININKTITKNQKLFYRNPKKPDFDVIQTTNISGIEIKPEKVMFLITIKNNQNRVLKLRDCAMVVLMNNIQYSFPDPKVRMDWENTLVMSNFSTNVTIPGPSIRELDNPKSIEVFINDIPTKIDDAGNTIKRENFDWLFSCSSEEKTEKGTINYSYDETPVMTQQCQACSGRGSFSEIKLCPTCNGTGRYKGYDGNIHQCYNCQGSGKVNVTTTCQSCGGKGILIYPKSPLPPVDSQETWSGWLIYVNTIPSGLTIKFFNPYLGQYQNNGQTPNAVSYYSSPSKLYPIIISYKNQEVKVIPTDNSGKKLDEIKVDFSSGSPVIKKGIADMN
jgi:hypothetical protein